MFFGGAMATNSRIAIVLSFLLLIPLLATPVSAKVAVEIDEPFWIEDYDLGLIGMGVGGSSGQKVIVVGEDGFSRVLDGVNPRDQITLPVTTDEALRTVSWHPRGNTALIAGDEGVFMRYAQEDHSLTTADNAGILTGIDIHAVSWNTAGSHAYLGGEGGWIWAYHEGEGGNAIFEPISDTKNSIISGIDCHPEISLCVVTTIDDGIAILDSRTNHSLYWIGGEGKRWHSVSCADPLQDTCIAVASELTIGLIGINTNQPKNSIIMTRVVSDSTGELTHVHARGPGESLIVMTPFEVIAWDHTDDEAYEWIEYQDVLNESSTLAGDSLIGSWGTIDNEDVGFLVTSQGGIVPFHPSKLSNEWTDTMVSYLVGAMVIIAVPGVILGLIFMNSTTMQSWYYNRRAAKIEAKENARIAAEKAAKKELRARKNR